LSRRSFLATTAGAGVALGTQGREQAGAQRPRMIVDSRAPATHWASRAK